MARSMTGFARVRTDADSLSMIVTIKSVNHRFMDIQIRMPPDLDPFEPGMRRMVKEHVRRGQLQITINLEWNAPPQETRLNRTLVEGYLAAFQEIARDRRFTTPPDPNILLRLPGAVTVVAAELDDEKRTLLEKTLNDTLVKALETLNESRRAEGVGIVEDLRKRVEAIGRALEELQAVREDTVQHFQRHLERKLTELLDRVGADPQRILQEAGVLAARADVSEELQRLRSHLQRLVEVFDGDGEIGKRVDFIAQELNRETSTILSKSSVLGQGGIAVSEIGVLLKGEIEKIREQAQNLE